jgi:hypothetical protein
MCLYKMPQRPVLYYYSIRTCQRTSDLRGSQGALECLCVCRLAQLGLREFNSLPSTSLSRMVFDEMHHCVPRGGGIKSTPKMLEVALFGHILLIKYFLLYCFLISIRGMTSFVAGLQGCGCCPSKDSDGKG